jgi:hypothetical protein
VRSTSKRDRNGDTTKCAGCSDTVTRTRSPLSSRAPTCPSTVSCAPPSRGRTSISSRAVSGSTSGRCVSVCGQIGVTTKTREPGIRIGPPAERL